MPEHSFRFCYKPPAGCLLKNVWRATNNVLVLVSGCIHMTVTLGVADRYASLLKINGSAITQFEITEVFQQTFGAVKKVVPYDRMGLSLYAPETGALRLAATAGCGRDSLYQVGLALDCKESHHGWVFRHKKAIVRRDLKKESEFQVEQQNVIEGIRSYCAVPLIVRGESLGVMIALSSQKNRYCEAHAEFLQEVSDQVALAVKSLIPSCTKHFHSRLICPRCIASGGGRVTAAKYKKQLSEWGKQGGRGRKKPAGGLTGDILR